MGGGTTTVQAPDNKPLLKLIEDMRRQQAEEQANAAIAQKETASLTQDTAAQKASESAAQQMEQTLGRMNAFRQAQDANLSEQRAGIAENLGTGITGGGFDVNAAAQQRLANLGAAAPLLPASLANLSGFGTNRNPAMPKSASTNRFALPTATDIRFGGI